MVAFISFVALSTLYTLLTLSTGVTFFAFFTLYTLFALVAFISLIAFKTGCSHNFAYIYGFIIGKGNNQLTVGINRCSAYAYAVSTVCAILAVFTVTAVYSVFTICAVPTVCSVFAYGISKVKLGAVGKNKHKLTRRIK